MPEVLLIAHFNRNLDFGGSQRATSIAERLEERGTAVRWQTILPRSVPRWEQAFWAATFRPPILSFHDSHTKLYSGPWRAAIAEHPYMAPFLRTVEDHVKRIVDFQDVQWWHLRDLSRLAGPLRRPYLAWHSRLMRRFEEKVIRSSSLCLFPTQAELSWANSIRGHTDVRLIPNMLPQAGMAAAEAIRERRLRESSGDFLTYVGTLSYPPNLESLLSFLKNSWPSVRRACPDLELVVIGRCDMASRRAIESHPGVEAKGFVRNLTQVLGKAKAVLFPLYAGAGTSLRILYFALAGLPIVGSPLAFRGFDADMGWIAATPQDWADAILQLMDDAASGRARAGAARQRALEIQTNPKPWDEFYDFIVQ